MIERRREGIINNLTQLPNLKVIARSSVFRYKGKETDPLAAGKLGVRAVLTGRVQQRGDTMVISVELIDIRDNKQLWGEKYESKLADMLSVQRDIAREITTNLRPTAHFFLARAYEAKGMYDEAVHEYTTAAAVSLVAPEVLAKMNEAYARSGWKAYVQTALEETVIKVKNKTAPVVVATFYARLGQKQETFAWLQKGYEERDFRLTMLSVSFEFDRFRSDPQFKELVRRVGLPE
ncbi:MAG TPA: hypothetical protein VGJ37_05100 [Pyrinomonadaceae bacterium]|jgi:hypothetical protein